MNNETWLQSVRWHIVQNQSSTQLQAAQTAAPSASAWTEREAIVSEDNIVFVNDLLPLRPGAISTYSAPAARSATHIRSVQFTCVLRNISGTHCFCLQYTQISYYRGSYWGFAGTALDCWTQGWWCSRLQTYTLLQHRWGAVRKLHFILPGKTDFFPSSINHMIHLPIGLFCMLRFLCARIISAGGGVSLNIKSEACKGTADEINTLEHVQVRWYLSFLQSIGRFASSWYADDMVTSPIWCRLALAGLAGRACFHVDRGRIACFFPIFQPLCLAKLIGCCSSFTLSEHDIAVDKIRLISIF